MKVIFLPKVESNPYQNLLASALAKNDVEVGFSGIFPRCGWLFRNRLKVAILHLHWPSFLYQMGWLTSLRWLIVLIRFSFAKLLGFKIVWTVHNLLPHERHSPLLDRMFRLLLIKKGDGIIVHCNEALNKVVATFGKPKKAVVIPHGNYDGSYPPLTQRSVARAKLDLPIEGVVFLCFGQIRGYKGLLELVQQFHRLASKATLVIAGSGDPYIEKEIRTEAEGNPVKLFLRYIPDEEVSRFFSAADALVTPYANILTSGAAILGLTFGIPVIAPSTGCLPELLADGAGLLYDPSKNDALFEALEGFLKADIPMMAKMARKKAERLNWLEIGESTALFYKNCIEKSAQYQTKT
jgi:beta-1,4-mannosyltransferase